MRTKGVARLLLRGLPAALPLAFLSCISGGRAIPPFRIDAGTGDGLEVRAEGGRLAVLEGGRQDHPRALVLFFFQPDCNSCEAQLQALEGLHRSLASREARVAAIAHRGEEAQVEGLRRRCQPGFPLYRGTDCLEIKELARGDKLLIVDRRGEVRYSQVGYGEGDEAIWRETVEKILSGEPVKRRASSREVLREGEELPPIELPLLAGGARASLKVEEGGIVFRDGSGVARRPRAAIGFYSRY